MVKATATHVDGSRATFFESSLRCMCEVTVCLVHVHAVGEPLITSTSDTLGYNQPHITLCIFGDLLGRALRRVCSNPMDQAVLEETARYTLF